MINVAVLGYGMSGATFHAPVIATVPELSLHTVVSTQREKVLKDFPHVTVRAEFSEALADRAVHLVVITLPTHLHAEFAAQALDAGKHVVVEKPFVHESAIGFELAARAKQRGVVLSVYQNRRWDNGFLTLRRCIESGDLGEIYSYEAHFDRFRSELKPEKWREQDLPGSGTFFDLGAHLIDQALTLFGRPETVWCDRMRQRPGAEVDDYFHIVFRYGKRRVILRSGYLVGVPGPVLEVHGTKGSFIKRGLDPQEEALKRGGRPRTPGWGLDGDSARLWRNDSGEFVESEIETLPGMYDEFYRQLAQAICGKALNPVTAEQGSDVIALLELCRASSDQGRVLPVPLVGRE